MEQCECVKWWMPLPSIPNNVLTVSGGQKETHE